MSEPQQGFPNNEDTEGQQGAALPRLSFDFGTAYDLFISLQVLHYPEKFGLRASWAAGVTMLIWIIVETALLGYISLLQPVIAIWSIGIIVLTVSPSVREYLLLPSFS